MSVRAVTILHRVEAILLALILLAQLVACQATASLPKSTTTLSPAGCVLTAIDGDTLRCGKERLRLSGIDSPELGRCRKGRVCVTGDPYRAKALLSARLFGTADVVRLGRDRYGRTIAAITIEGIDLSCSQLQARAAEYRPQWDNRGLIAARCPAVAR